MSFETLTSLHASLGLPTPDPARVEIAGADPALATRFRVGEAAAAALAAPGISAGWRRVRRTREGIDEERAGERPVTPPA